MPAREMFEPLQEPVRAGMVVGIEVPLSEGLAVQEIETVQRVMTRLRTRLEAGDGP